MSSDHGGPNAGGTNEDVEADESMRTEDARAIEHIEPQETETAQELDDFGDFEQPVANGFEDEAYDEHELPEDEADLPLDEQDYARLDAVDIRQLDRSSPDIGPSSPIAASPARSPAGSDSIPDDTPSLQGSGASSPLRVASPRRTPLRINSGALQPFEKRFETRLSASPTASPRGASPAFLSPHSRQISLSSQVSQISSQDDAASDGTPQAPWDVVKWTSLRKISTQAFSEAGRRNFGRPTCLAVSALIAVGTSKGLILGFDYHQTLKIIIGQGTTATECGSVTALAIAADYSTIAAGHANGHIFTWEVNRPARPFLRVPPISRTSLQQAGHPHGHVQGTAILHLGFLGTRHTALVSADAGGMAFSHLATRGLGPVTRVVKSTRLLGRYPPADPNQERSRKPSSVLAFSSLPLGNVEQPTDSLGLTALLTPYLLVIVSTTPIAQTQHKSGRPKDVKPHSTLSGCLAWFPAVKLKASNQVEGRETSNTKLAYCWSNVLTVLEVKALANEDADKPPSLEFHTRGRWHAEEPIVAVQWLGRSVLGVLTISQRLLILEDGKLRVTDSIDLLQKHIYHQDLFSEQLQATVERLDPNDPEMHGVVADAFFMSFRVYKGRIFFLGFDGITVGTLSNWADRLMALMEAGDHIAAVRLATEYFTGGASNAAVGLPDAEPARHSVVRERLIAMVTASLQYTFSQYSEGRGTRIRELADVSFDACVTMGETDYLFSEVFEIFEEANEESVFVITLEPYILDGEVRVLPPDVIKSMVDHYISEGKAARLEELLCRLDPFSFDLDQTTMLCRQHSLYDALIYVWTRAIGDFVTPLIDLLSLIKILDGDEDVENNPFLQYAMKLYPYLAYSLTGRRYPGGDYMDEPQATAAKADLYNYVFSGRPTTWPPGTRKIFHTSEDTDVEPAFPYLVLLLEFDAPNFMSMLNEAFEDPFLNEPDEEHALNALTVNGTNGRQTMKMTRQHIISIMLEVMQQNDFETDQIAYLDMFIARSLPKYPGQLVLSGSLLTTVLRRLCQPPSETLRDDCQLSVEYLLSAFHPPDVSSIVQWLRKARFFRVLKTVYRGQKMFTELIETFFEDPENKHGVFECIKDCLQATSGTTSRQQAVKERIRAHFQDLCDIDAVSTARTLAASSRDLLQPAVAVIEDPHQQFTFLRSLLEPTLLPEGSYWRSAPALSTEDQTAFVETYVRLMCAYDARHVADYVGVLPSGNLKLDNVLPAMEKSGVIDAAVVLLARDGLARDAMDRLVEHLQSLQKILSSLVDNASESPDASSTLEAAEDMSGEIQKYTKVGVWLCQGQSANVQRRQRPRNALTQNLKEDDLDLDEFLWLNLIDAVVYVTKNTTTSVQTFEDVPTEQTEVQTGLRSVVDTLRGNVQQVFTALLAATAVTNPQQSQSGANRTRSSADNLSFIRVLRAFLNRASITAPSLSDLRVVLADIFSAYTFEQGVLSLANELLGSDVFVDIEEANTLRQKGWRPRSQVCEHCKRRAWGQGIGEAVWDEWVSKEQAREHDKARKLVERGGGEEARKLERGKGKASGSSTGQKQHDESEETRRLALIVFACRHVFHRVCLDQDYKDGKPPKAGPYQCPLCT